MTEQEKQVCLWRDCSEEFETPDLLYAHLCERHIGRKSLGFLNLNCNWADCTSQFSKRDHITSHVRIHLDFKPYVCDLCGKNFKRTQDYRKHQKTHGLKAKTKATKPRRRQTSDDWRPEDELADESHSPQKVYTSVSSVASMESPPPMPSHVQNGHVQNGHSQNDHVTAPRPMMQMPSVPPLQMSQMSTMPMSTMPMTSMPSYIYPVNPMYYYPYPIYQPQMLPKPQIYHTAPVQDAPHTLMQGNQVVDRLQTNYYMPYQNYQSQPNYPTTQVQENRRQQRQKETLIEHMMFVPPGKLTGTIVAPGKSVVKLDDKLVLLIEKEEPRMLLDMFIKERRELQTGLQVGETREEVVDGKKKKNKLVEWFKEKLTKNDTKTLVQHALASTDALVATNGDLTLTDNLTSSLTGNLTNPLTGTFNSTDALVGLLNDVRLNTLSLDRSFELQVVEQHVEEDINLEEFLHDVDFEY